MQLYQVAVESIHHPWLEWVSWGAQILLFAVAVVAAAFGRRQLREMTDYREQRLRIANAQLLMDLDNRWDSKDMHESRMLFNKVRDDINETVGAANPKAKDNERERKIEDAWVEKLAAMRVNDAANYGKLMAICSFFETVGLMVKREYIQADDVLELLLGPIMNIEKCFGGHIKALEKEMGVLAGLYEHALNLSKLAAREAARISRN
jgi:hypothetical protein